MKIRILKKKKLNEEFYFQQGFDEKSRPPANPLSIKLVELIASKLPGSKNVRANQMKRIKASGAEGIVISLDDKRVVKIFHDLENAAKNLHLVSKNVPGTSQVYSMGKIFLNDPVVYYKFGSTHNRKTLANPTKELWYIVMQRVIPDDKIYRYVEEEWDKINRISRLDIKGIQSIYALGSQQINNKLELIFKEIIENPEQYVLNNAIKKKIERGEIQSLSDILKNRKDSGRFAASLVAFRKGKTKQFLFNTNTGGGEGYSVSLKNLLLNAVGAKNDLKDAQRIYEFFKTLPQMQKKAKKVSPHKANKSATLADDLQEIYDVIDFIRIRMNLPWNDIHQEQFGRDANGNLVGLDLGIKEFYPNKKAEEIGKKKADGKFEAANVIRVATNFNQEGNPTMTLAEDKNKMR